MNIYSMTATFGKLDHQTLTLKPGLNVIEAPNEWGKSTWCAFLVAMLYGIDTRERTKQGSLADKERYAPWSGSPMSGRMELHWNGRDITIERSTKGRSVFGQFRAYETHTGLEVTELTAANCGEMLLGVEKSVFLRAGFLRLADLPVTQDESLRRRLNALVTTGDESGASDVLAQKLRDLKNHCQSNRANGLIPKAQAQKAALEDTLQQIAALQEQSRRIQTRQAELSRYSAQLKNHRAALEYAEAQTYTQKAAEARLQLEAVNRRVAELEQTCQALPDSQTLLHRLSQLQQLRASLNALQMEAQMRPASPAAPEIPAPFRGCTPQQAAQQAKEDFQAYQNCQKQPKGPSVLLWILSVLLLVGGGIGLALQQTILGIGLLAAGLAALVVTLVLQSNTRTKRMHLQNKADLLLQQYRPLKPEQWEPAAADYSAAQSAYEEASEQHRAELSHLRTQAEEIRTKLEDLTGQTDALQCERDWQTGLEQHRQYADALREQRRIQETVQAYATRQTLPEQPRMPDSMHFTLAETNRLLADADYEGRQLSQKLSHCQGRMATLGQEDALRQQLESVNARLARLEDTYAALELAMQTLVTASAELQRKFAPRISRRAQELFARLTGSRYDRLSLGEDLSVSVGAQNEDTLRGAMWRSEGTVDQLYLALRLAVSEELTAQAPLVLDDALVRFDDRRLAAAMEIMKECAQERQIILFTCQSRESALQQTHNSTKENAL